MSTSSSYAGSAPTLLIGHKSTNYVVGGRSPALLESATPCSVAVYVSYGSTDPEPQLLHISKYYLLSTVTDMVTQSAFDTC